MANIKSAIKRNNQNAKLRLQNRHFRNRTRTLVKNAQMAIESGNIEEAAEATRLAVKDIDMLASKGVIHSKNADRRKSRLMKKLAQLQAS